MIQNIKKRNGDIQAFDINKIKQSLQKTLIESGYTLSLDIIIEELYRIIYDGISTRDLAKALIFSVVSFIEKNPDYNYFASHLFLNMLYHNILGKITNREILAQKYRDQFSFAIHHGVNAGLLDKRMLLFDLAILANAIEIKRDHLFGYIGMQTLHERYFLKDGSSVLELPQIFWMRVAMGLAFNEVNKEAKAIEFYHVLSSLHFVSSTPTLFHSGTVHPQLSSCYLTYVDDDLNHIFKCLKDNANMSKWSGGVANSWSQLRATGSMIKSIKMGSQGIIPFLKLANDVVSAIYRSGSRRGATVAYLEVWHYDFDDFLDLRRNTGDERRRTHDMNTAAWVPDLFMKRVNNNQDWTFFSPDETPDLHDLYGKKFEDAYEHYEQKALRGEMRIFKQQPAVQIWRKILSRLFETGHPWITFKDACNIRSPQDHVGVVHSSNLCTEITLNTSREETAVCNLGSINLGRHINNGILDKNVLAQTIRTAVRMLDNVIDINFYPTDEGKVSNFRHRPIGLGIMGLQNALFELNINFEDEEAITWCDTTMEFISYHAILTSTELANERGAYQSFKGSKWDRDILPVDTLDLLEKERGLPIKTSRSCSLDWEPVRQQIKHYGIRNSNLMAIAPTATISNISGCFPSIEPIFKNMYVKSNMSGEFTIINEYLVHDLQKLGLWDQDMLDTIKYHDGSIQHIDTIPQHIKNKYKEAFEIDPEWLIKLTAVRAKWIDQSQSHNIFIQGTSGKKLNDVYMTAWHHGLKATYYLRSLGASQIEKATIDAKKFGFTQKRTNKDSQTQTAPDATIVPATVMTGSCSIDDLSCESCQ